MDMFKDIVTNTVILTPQNFATYEADLHIAFGIDANFVRGMGVLINSISAANANEKIMYHIFNDGMNAEDLRRLKELSKYDRMVIKLYFIDRSVLEKLPTTIAWSLATYYRFVMGKVLYGQVDKVLYLDADILCIGALSSLKHMDMGNHIVMAIAEEGDVNVRRLSLKQGKYFNAGVLYIDLNKWNEENISEKALRLIQEDPRKYTYLDQDVLNLLLDGKTRFIDRKWNYLYDMRKMDSALPEGIILVHFIGDKPWQRWSEHHFMAELYAKAMDQSPWGNTSLNEPIHYKEKKRMARSYRIRNRYLKAIGWYVNYAVSKLMKNFE